MKLGYVKFGHAKPKIRCYVTSEACRVMQTAKPGTYVGSSNIAVSGHNDYQPWRYGKRDTVRLTGMKGYMGKAAQAVCLEMGWEWKKEKKEKEGKG